MAKKTHGGKRKGAGRKKTSEETRVVRVPLSLIPEIKRLIKNHKKKDDYIDCDNSKLDLVASIDRASTRSMSLVEIKRLQKKTKL